MGTWNWMPWVQHVCMAWAVHDHSHMLPLHLKPRPFSRDPRQFIDCPLCLHCNTWFWYAQFWWLPTIQALVYTP